jgi:hypothetical protein
VSGLVILAVVVLVVAGSIRFSLELVDYLHKDTTITPPGE